MGKRLKTYLEKMEQLNPEQLTEKQRKEITKDLLIQIGFFQHERLIHLIVTVTFALLALISVLSAAALQQPLILLLTALFLSCSSRISCITICWKTGCRSCTPVMTIFGTHGK